MRQIAPKVFFLQLLSNYIDIIPLILQITALFQCGAAVFGKIHFARQQMCNVLPLACGFYKKSIFLFVAPK